MIRLDNTFFEKDIEVGKWKKILQLAEDNGWRPQGTMNVEVEVNDEVINCDLGYLDARGQFVTRDDVARLQVALKKKLCDGDFRKKSELTQDVFDMVNFLNYGGIQIRQRP